MAALVLAKSKKKRMIKNSVPKIVSEHGLGLQYGRGELVVEVGAEPDNPKSTVTRLRRNCAYDEMMNRGTITKEQRDYAERYAILCEQAGGSTGDLYAGINLLREGGGGSKWEPSQRQSDAYEKLFFIWREMGRYHTRILDMIVLNNYSCKSFAESQRIHRHYAMGQILSTFILLEETFERISE